MTIGFFQIDFVRENMLSTHMFNSDQMYNNDIKKSGYCVIFRHSLIEYENLLQYEWW